MLKYDLYNIGKFPIGSVVIFKEEADRNCYPQPKFEHEHGPGHVEGFYLNQDGTVLIKVSFVNPSFNGLLDLVDPEKLIPLKN